MMVNKIHTILGILLILVLFTSCGDIDNYDAPDAVFHGKIVTEDGSYVQQRLQNNTGLKFALYETERENSLPQYFYAKPDGTFENKMLFSGNYSIVMEQTNFYPVDEKLQRIEGNTECDFIVTPFSEIRNVEVKHLEDRKVHVKFSINRKKDEGCKILNYTVYGHVSPKIDDLSANSLVSERVVTTINEDTDLLNETLEIILDMDEYPGFHEQYAHIVKANNNLIYIRISVMTGYPYTGDLKDTGKIYVNFSEVIPVAVTF